MKPRHLIDECIFDISFNSADAERALQQGLPDDLQGLLTESLLPIVDEVLTQHSKDGSVYVLDVLEIDLGDIPSDQFAYEMARRLRGSLDDLLQAKRSTMQAEAKADPAQGKRSQSLLDQLESFLLSGKMLRQREADDGWNGWPHQRLLEEVLQADSKNFMQCLLRHAQDNNVIARLVRQFSQPQLLAVLRLYIGGAADHLLHLMQELQAVCGQLAGVDEVNDIASVTTEAGWRHALTLALSAPGLTFDANKWLALVVKNLATSARKDEHSMTVALRDIARTRARSSGANTPALTVALTALSEELRTSHEDKVHEHKVREDKAFDAAPAPTDTTLPLPDKVANLRHRIAEAILSGASEGIASIWQELLRGRAELLKEALFHYGVRAEIRQRLVHGFPDTMVRDMIAVLHNDAALMVDMALAHPMRFQQAAASGGITWDNWKQSLLESSLDLLLQEPNGGIDRRAYLHQLLKKMAGSDRGIRLALAEAWMHIEPSVETGGAFQSMQQELVALQTENDAQESATLVQGYDLYDQVRQQLSGAIAGAAMSQSLTNHEGTGNINDEMRRQDATVSSTSSTLVPDLASRLLQSIDSLAAEHPQQWQRIYRQLRSGELFLDAQQLSEAALKRVITAIITLQPDGIVDAAAILRLIDHQAGQAGSLSARLTFLRNVLQHLLHAEKTDLETILAGAPNVHIQSHDLSPFTATADQNITLPVPQLRDNVAAALQTTPQKALQNPSSPTASASRNNAALVQIYQQLRQGDSSLVSANLNEDELRRLVAQYVTLEPMAAAQDRSAFLLSIEVFAGEVSDKRFYFEQVLTQLVRHETIDLEHIAALASAPGQSPIQGTETVVGQTGVAHQATELSESTLAGRLPDKISGISSIDDRFNDGSKPGLRMDHIDLALPYKKSASLGQISNLRHRLAAAMLSGTAADLFDIWPSLMRDHRDLVRGALQQYLVRPDIRRQLVQACPESMLRDMLATLQSDAMALIDLVLLHPRTFQLAAAIGNAIEWTNWKWRMWESSFALLIPTPASQFQLQTFVSDLLDGMAQSDTRRHQALTEAWLQAIPADEAHDELAATVHFAQQEQQEISALKSADDSAILLRGYDLYDLLKSQLHPVAPSVSLTQSQPVNAAAIVNIIDAIEELGRQHQAQFQRLYRQLREGELTFAACQFDVDQLKRLVTIIVSCHPDGFGDTHAIVRILDANANQASDQTAYFRQVLTRLLEDDPVDLEPMLKQVAVPHSVNADAQIGSEVASDEAVDVEQLRNLIAAYFMFEQAEDSSNKDGLNNEVSDTSSDEFLRAVDTQAGQASDKRQYLQQVLDELVNEELKKLEYIVRESETKTQESASAYEVPNKAQNKIEKKAESKEKHRPPPSGNVRSQIKNDRIKNDQNKDTSSHARLFVLAKKLLGSTNALKAIELGELDWRRLVAIVIALDPAAKAFDRNMFLNEINEHAKEAGDMRIYFRLVLSALIEKRVLDLEAIAIESQALAPNDAVGNHLSTDDATAIVADLKDMSLPLPLVDTDVAKAIHKSKSKSHSSSVLSENAEDMPGKPEPDRTGTGREMQLADRKLPDQNLHAPNLSATEISASEKPSLEVGHTGQSSAVPKVNAQQSQQQKMGELTANASHSEAPQASIVGADSGQVKTTNIKTGKTPSGQDKTPLAATSEATLKMFFDVRLTPKPALSTNAIAALEDLLVNNSTSLNTLLSDLLNNASACTRLVENIPERLLTRIVLLLRRVDHSRLQTSADLVGDAFAEVYPAMASHRIALLKWQYIFRYLFITKLSFVEEFFVLGLQDTLLDCVESQHREQVKQRMEQKMTPNVASVIAPITASQNAISSTQSAAKNATQSLPRTPAQKKSPEAAQKQQQEQQQEQQADPQGDIYIANAGLVLLAPYLPRLFSAVNLTENGAFIDRAAAERGLHLLQFLVNGSSETPEYQLVLNKILCGVKTGIPISAGISFTAQEKEIAESLLQGVIQNWKGIGNTTVNGLRETFLQRSGWLELKDEAWQLQVQPKTFDMLLDRLPWSFSIIKHPWMERAVHVNWR